MKFALLIAGVKGIVERNPEIKGMVGGLLMKAIGRGGRKEKEALIASSILQRARRRMERAKSIKQGLEQLGEAQQDALENALGGLFLGQVMMILNESDIDSLEDIEAAGLLLGEEIDVEAMFNRAVAGRGAVQ